MSLIYDVRKKIIQTLWQNYAGAYPHIQKIISALPEKNIVLDHFAVLDLPGPQTGLSVLNQLFSVLNYLPCGRDYLESKQNEFMWLAPFEAPLQKAEKASLQIVLADFRLKDLTASIRKIIIKYSRQAPEFPWQYFHRLSGKVFHGDKDAAEKLMTFIVRYCQQRDWPPPTVREYFAVKEANELLSWVLVFGRCINHFGINIRFLNNFENLESFNDFIQQKLAVPLNQTAGVIKGSAQKDLAQSSTAGETITVNLQDGSIPIASPFIEFIWRASKVRQPVYWHEYFTDFISPQADYVVQSVYLS